MSYDLDALLEDIARDLPIEVPVLSDAKAAAFHARLAALRAELDAGRKWWEARRETLSRQTEWLERQLVEYARHTHAETGMKRFPVGMGEAVVTKARAVVRWDEEAARPWLERLAVSYPEIVKDFRRSEVMGFVKFAPADEKGLRVAVSAADGEILPGLVEDTRPGQVHVAIK